MRAPTLRAALGFVLGVAFVVGAGGCDAERVLAAHGAKLEQRRPAAASGLATPVEALPLCAAAEAVPSDWIPRLLPGLGFTLALPPRVARQALPAEVRPTEPAPPAGVHLQAIDAPPELWMGPDSAAVMLVANMLNWGITANGASTALPEPSCAVLFQGARLRAEPMIMTRRGPQARPPGAASDTSFALLLMSDPPHPGGGAAVAGAAFFWRRDERAAFVAALAGATPASRDVR